jgi:hypothetical protein
MTGDDIYCHLMTENVKKLYKYNSSKIKVYSYFSGSATLLNRLYIVNKIRLVKYLYEYYWNFVIVTLET